MKTHFKIVVPIIAFCLAILCGVTIHLISQIQSYSKLINYVGIVRGATQRLVKLETNGIKSDDIITYLDDILQELTTGTGNIGLVQINDTVYNKDLKSLYKMWGVVKAEVTAVRNGAKYTELINVSEKYFKLANDTVFAAETYSNHQTKLLSILILTMVATMVLTWSFIFVKRLLNLEKANDDLSNKIYMDILTGAPTIEKFRLNAQALLDKRSDKQYAILYVDIDNFKYYNDVFGSPYGDEILKKYTEILKCDMDTLDTFCHISADNFLILRCYKDKSELISRQESVDKKIAKYVLDTKEQYLFTLSCGICCTEDLSDIQQINNLIERANFARKTVKNHPLNHYAFYNESIRDKMLSEKAIENRMHTALENREFVVFMQPKINLKTGKIASAEALVRWIAPDGRIVPPDDFIPIFEKNLFISSLDQYVMEEACKWICKRIDTGLYALPVSVNVSRMQLYDPEFVKSYTTIKDKYNIPPQMVEIEFTESMVFENLTMLLKIIASLKQENFLCSLDDFGKGYSSLNLLKKLPVDVLKLDKLFFDEDDQPEKAHAIITCIVSMVKKLNIKIVAEGVENHEQVEFLHDIGCDLVQGYVFYRPMPLEQLELILAEDKIALPQSLH